ncbi:hypothetical protein CROQUDRAFT_659062 [Cronartium quercuum f. sp. fusiforme G11]|uniref:Uncharacterized protein n=1 Tax=Cronartium quercuum f. sp. fusiforme G11 TaxID=708437 RepID=A0A9P6NGE5_9BASI|nr:hypothetical protein CROQUDRAFT_659062 [Cronartium quercuum f. sp. fusiforme G11]
MGYVFYSAKTKVMAVLLILNGKTDIEVRTAIVDNPCNKTIDRWVVLYERTSLETVHLELTTRLEITCKKARTSNIRKDFYQRAVYQALVRYIPAEICFFHW